MSRLIGALRVRAALARLRLLNRYGRKSLLGTTPVVVSLTSYSTRIATVHLSVESIARGALRPSRIILWIDEQPVLDDLPPRLAALRARGLEIRPCENFGPHKKYYPYVASMGSDGPPLVLADDDVLYPKYWLEGLMSAYRADRAASHGYRAKRVSVVGTSLASYASWPNCDTTEPSVANFLTGVGGSLLPLPLQLALARAGESFRAVCPRADDVWLHFQAVSNGIAVHQVDAAMREFATIPGTQDYALTISNVAHGENDEQIQATYGREQVALIASALREDNYVVR